MVDISKLNKIEVDVLRETGNIGCAHAATAISNKIKRKINISVPEIEIIKVEDLNDKISEFKSGTDKVAAIYQEMIENFSGSILFIFPTHSALAITDLLLQRDIGITKEFAQTEINALLDVGETMVKAYTEALGGFFNEQIGISKPMFTHDIPDAVMDNIRKILDKETTHAVVFNTLLTDEEKLFKSYFIILPSPTALDTMINKLLS
ncbi:chemotaxis protein CheC [Patescibacteria group bacterium]